MTRNYQDKERQEKFKIFYSLKLMGFFILLAEDGLGVFQS